VEADFSVSNKIRIGCYLSRSHDHLPLERIRIIRSTRIAIDVMQEPTILIVDDVSDIVDEMIQMLELLDLSAVGAHSIDAAIKQLSLHSAIRLVVCDLRLSGESGIEIPKRIEADPALTGREFAYLFMTGDADQARSVAMRPNGVVMTKPINPRKLIATIVELLERKAGVR
jgi:DNA-binding NtrC family response regulator